MLKRIMAILMVLTLIGCDAGGLLVAEENCPDGGVGTIVDGGDIICITTDAGTD